MNSPELFEQLGFVENPFYEKIISDIQEQKFSIIDDFFDQSTIEYLRLSLLEKYQHDDFKKSAIGNKTNELISKKTRGDYIFWLNEAKNNPSEKAFFSQINELIEYLNRTCFMGILHKEFHYAVYPTGTFYKRHLDTFQNDDRRKLSFVCYLNPSWEEAYGGELVLYLSPNGREQEKSIFPVAGRVVLFESQILEHEVKPILSSERLSITGWLKTR